MAADFSRRILLLTPPLVQPNTPYPATMHLKASLDALGVESLQVDLSVKILGDILRSYGGDAADELLEILSGRETSLEAKISSSVQLEALAAEIRSKVDRLFGFSRYSQEECLSLRDFGALEKLVSRRGVLDDFLEARLFEVASKFRPTDVWVTCPFPGTVVGAFKIARFFKRAYPRVRLVLGGGFVNTELRHMRDARPRKYFDLFAFDAFEKRPFLKPSYEGVDWDDYFDFCTDEDLSSLLWNSGRWIKLIMAQGCYWHKCAFCDVCLSYVGTFRMPEPGEIVDAMQELGTEFHFVDEAMPPALVDKVCDEIIKRRFDCVWWGNIRFDSAFTARLARKMADAGCIAVTGALECANDRLLGLMNKGITLASATKVLEAFKKAGIKVHAYLMYDFPTETKREQKEAERYVKSLADRDLVQSAFWHRFALTVHSPIYKAPDRFSLEVEPVPKGPLFALNEMGYKRKCRTKNFRSL